MFLLLSRLMESITLQRLFRPQCRCKARLGTPRECCHSWGYRTHPKELGNNFENPSKYCEILY